MLVLVTYASRHGSTREIAERIAATLGEHGSTVEVRPVDKVHGVGTYDAVVLGSAVYNGSWGPEATAFVRRNRFVLADRPVWLFSVGERSAPFARHCILVITVYLPVSSNAHAGRDGET